MKKLKTMILIWSMLLVASLASAQLTIVDNTTATPTSVIKNYSPITMAVNLIDAILETGTNSGYVDDIATPTFTIDSDDTVVLSAYLPSNINGFELRCASGSFIIGGNTIATSPTRIGRLISSGESFQWNGSYGVPSVYLKTTQDSSLVIIDGAW